MNFFITFGYMFMALYPCIWLIYNPFFDRLTWTKKRTMWLSAAFVVAFCIHGSFRYAETDIDPFANAYNIVIVLIVFVLYRKSIKEGIHKLLFIFSVIMHIAASIGDLRYGVQRLLREHSLLTEYIHMWKFIDAGLRIALYPLVWLMLSYWFIPRLKRIDSRHMKGLWFIPVVFFFISYSYTINQINEGMTFDATVYMIAFTIIVISSLAIYVLLLRILEGTAKNTRLEADILSINRQLDIQREQYTRMYENDVYNKAMRHDMRHHLAVLDRLAEEENAGSVKEYVVGLTGKLNYVKDREYCKNRAVNAVVSNYLGMAESEGITVEVRLAIPEETGLVPSMDLCVVLGNLLENAAEACRHVENGEKFIRVHARRDGDALLIIAANSFDGTRFEGSGVYYSRKTGNEDTPRMGVGLSSIKAICEKHRGMVEHEINGNTWTASVLIRIS
jgi:signal transduction histidine kinase